MPFPVQRHLFGPFLTAHFQWDIILFRSLSFSPMLYIGINRFDINETINEIHCSLKSIFRMMRIMRQTVVIRSSACILIMLPLEWIINKCHYFMMQWLLSIHINYTEESLWALVRSSLAGWWCTHTHTHIGTQCHWMKLFWNRIVPISRQIQYHSLEENSMGIRMNSMKTTLHSIQQRFQCKWMKKNPGRLFISPSIAPNRKYSFSFAFAAAAIRMKGYKRRPLYSIA